MNNSFDLAVQEAVSALESHATEDWFDWLCDEGHNYLRDEGYTFNVRIAALQEVFGTC